MPLTPRLRRAAITTGLLLAAILTAAAVLHTISPSGTGHSRTPPAANRPTPQARPARPAPDSPIVPVLDLSGLAWTGYHGMELPVSAQAGPHDTAHGLASGYADTPLGALLAAINIGVRTAWQWGPGVFQPTIQYQVTGSYEPEMLSVDLDADGQGASEVTGNQASAREVAYQYEGYTASDATVDIVTEAPDGNGGTVYAATQIEVQWLNDDWRVVAPPGGDWGNSATQIASLSGYLILPGQGG